MKENQQFLEKLFDKDGISVIDTDKKGRPQTSLEYTLQLVFKYMEEFQHVVTQRELMFLVDSIGEQNPNIERDYQSEIYNNLKQIYNEYGKNNIRVQRGFKSMKDFYIFSNPATKDAVAMKAWNMFFDVNEKGEQIIRCEKRDRIENVKYIGGESSIGTDINGTILKGNTFATVITAVYSEISKEENPMSYEVARTLLDQIPEDEGKGYRPSLRIIDLYRPGVVVTSFVGKNVTDKDRLVFSYLGSEAVVIDTMWNQKKDGKIYPNLGQSLVFTNIDELKKLQTGESSFLEVKDRQYHKQRCKIKKKIDNHLWHTTNGYKWYLTYKRAKQYVREMNSLLELNSDDMYDVNFPLAPEKRKNEELNNWITKQKNIASNPKSNMSNMKRTIIEKEFGSFSYDRIKFAWNCKVIRQYQDKHNGKNPTNSVNPKLSIFINNSRKIVKQVTDKIYNKRKLTELEEFQIQQLLQIGLIDRVISSIELKKAMAEYFVAKAQKEVEERKNG